MKSNDDIHGRERERVEPTDEHGTYAASERCGRVRGRGERKGVCIGRASMVKDCHGDVPTTGRAYYTLSRGPMCSNRQDYDEPYDRSAGEMGVSHSYFNIHHSVISDRPKERYSGH